MKCSSFEVITHLYGSSLCHRQGQLLSPPILDQSEGFFDRIDDECMFVHQHTVRDFGCFLMSVLNRIVSANAALGRSPTICFERASAALAGF